MTFTLIICTYKRPQPILKLLNSVSEQTLYPDEILIVDGSPDDDTKESLSNHTFKNLCYNKVTEHDRGLTKQRNFGISKLSENTQIVCFLDDDTILDPKYFEELINTYYKHPEALGVGGYITNEVNWYYVGQYHRVKKNEFFYDGFFRIDSSRFLLRKKLGLDSDKPPGFLPEFSHGRNIAFLPPSRKIYQVEQLMGGVSSFKKSVFDQFQFSTYFEGYGLYEDADFTLRVSKTGKLFVNTAAKLEHHHDPAGRPNHYKYGKMVVRNGWYVWRVKYPQPKFSAKIKWHCITMLLLLLRATNIFNTHQRAAAFKESLGRFVGWVSLFVKKPSL